MSDYDFKSIHIDLEKGIYEINGESVKVLPITELILKFNGVWELNCKTEYYASNEKNSDLEP